MRRSAARNADTDGRLRTEGGVRPLRPGVVRGVSALALCALLLAGCASEDPFSTGSGGTGAPAPQPSIPSDAPAQDPEGEGEPDDGGNVVEDAVESFILLARDSDSPVWPSIIEFTAPGVFPISACPRGLLGAVLFMPFGPSELISAGEPLPSELAEVPSPEIGLVPARFYRFDGQPFTASVSVRVSEPPVALRPICEMSDGDLRYRVDRGDVVFESDLPRLSGRLVRVLEDGSEVTVREFSGSSPIRLGLPDDADSGWVSARFSDPFLGYLPLVGWEGGQVPGALR